MKLIHHFYLSIFFLIRKAKYFNKASRARFLIELEIEILCASILFIIVGFFNIRFNNLMSISILLFLIFFSANILCRLIFGNGREVVYIKSTKNYDSKQKQNYALVGLAILVMSFIMMILSAIIMSYLWSLELFKFEW